MKRGYACVFSRKRCKYDLRRNFLRVLPIVVPSPAIVESFDLVVLGSTVRTFLAARRDRV